MASAASDTTAASTSNSSSSSSSSSSTSTASGGVSGKAAFVAAHGLSKEAVGRYCRQMLMPQFGPAAQEKLRKTSFLVVGAGGLGSTAALYLGGAGVGSMTLVDADSVDVSNLHRQVIHKEATAGQPKVQSAIAAITALNSGTKVTGVSEMFTSLNGLQLVSSCDVVVDCTDNATARYLISDACVLAGKPLISGAALGTDGQMSVYNYKGGPCYRCLNPNPPSYVGGCSDLGVLGPVPGLIGCLQAIEAIKVACDIGTPLSQRMFVYDALEGRVRVVRIRGKKEDCVACSKHATITSLADTDKNLKQLHCEDASLPNTDATVPTVSVAQYKEVRDKASHHVLLDVRRAVQFGMCTLPGARNLPYAELAGSYIGTEATPEALAVIDKWRKVDGSDKPAPLYVLCRRGIDSIRACKLLMKAGVAEVYNVEFGLQEWAAKVDAEFPSY